MNTCDTCKHWEQEFENYGACYNPKVNGDDPSKQFAPTEGENRESWATPDASDTHNICFYTGPKFGCIHWEAKP